MGSAGDPLAEPQRRQARRSDGQGGREAVREPRLQAAERRRPTGGPLAESPAASEAASAGPVTEPQAPTADDAESESASALDAESGAAPTVESEATEE